MSRRRKSVHQRLSNRNRRRFRNRNGSHRSDIRPNAKITRSDLIRTTATRELILSPDAYYTGQLAGQSDWLKTLKWWSTAIMKICAVLSSFASSDPRYTASAVPIGCSKVLPIVPADFIIATPYKNSVEGTSERKAWCKTTFSAARLLRLHVTVSPAVSSSEIRGEVALAVIDTQKMNEGPYQEIKLLNNMTFDQVVQNFHGRRVDLTERTRLHYTWKPKNGSNSSKVQPINLHNATDDVCNTGHCCTLILHYRNLSMTTQPKESSFNPSNSQLRLTLRADLELSLPTDIERKVACFIYHQNVEQTYSIERFGKVVSVPKEQLVVENGIFRIPKAVEDMFDELSLSDDDQIEVVDN